ncbi:MAG TPA: hypothetical protein VJS65_11695, partial [Verrucomicrobiae bacterium]|nr:hypothetical protein [Verrucomicrobiae bacterium]
MKRSCFPSISALAIMIAGVACLDALAQSSSTNILRGTLSVPGEQDLYTFTLTNRARFYFDALTNATSLNWSLEGPTGTLVDHVAFTGADAGNGSVLSLVPGAYRLTVNGDGNSTNSYAFRLLDLAAAALLTPGTVVSNALSPGNETKAYQFNSTAGDRLLFDRQFLSAGQSMWWRLIDPFGNEVFSTPFNDVAGVTQRGTGTYTLLVEGYAANDRPATNSFVITPQGNTPPAPFSGTPLIIGASVSGA